MDICKYAIEHKIPTPIAINDKEFRDFFKGIKIDTAVEIGTQRGMSAAWIAQYAKKVYTFDIVKHEERYKIWDDLGVSKKITFIFVSGEENKDNILNIMDFDFAFIDGDHSYKGVKSDFNIVKSCGRVLFHDTAPRENGSHDGVIQFIEELGNVEVNGNIGYWSCDE